jgi:hypothetical protein
MKKILLFSLLAVFAVSCSQFAYKSLLQLRKGQSVSQVQSYLAADKFVHSIFIHNKDTYNISSDMKDMARRPVHIIIKKIYHFQAGQYYVYAFENDGLIYWGNPIDFEKTLDPFLRRIADISNDIIDRIETGKSVKIDRYEVDLSKEN